MFYKCCSKLIDTFKVLYAAQKALNCMYSKGGQLVITDKKIDSRQEQARSFLIKIMNKI